MLCDIQQTPIADNLDPESCLILTTRNIENRDPVLEFVRDFKLTIESVNGAKVSMVPA